MRIQRFPGFLSCLALSLAVGQAQVSNVTDVEATPIPGAGHDYIGILGETVNPANGSLSIRIHVPVPKGRALSLPFAFAYDSNGGSWSYTLPSLTAGAAQTVKRTPPGDSGDPEICKYSAGYVFTDLNGTRHAFPNMSYVATSFVDSCDDLGYSTNLTDSDPLVSVRASGNGVAVQDADGTTYSFALGAVSNPPIVTAIEDRNGNTVTYNTSNINVTTVTDTAGRVVVSTNGLGGSAGGTVYVSGISKPYTTSSGGSSPTYNPGYTRYFTQPDASTCPSPPTAPSWYFSQDGPSIGTLGLPNGENYTFTYDPTYGAINEILYPNGGWIKYTWGLNPQSEAYFGEAYLNNGQPNGLCGWRFGTPVITKRQVSFDGSTIAEEQDFTYNTVWTDNNNDASAVRWTSKSTTVVSYDELRNPNKGLSSTKIYTYAPAGIQGVVYSVGGGIGTLVPVESKVVSQDWNGSVLQTVNTTWANQYLMSSEQTVLPNGSASQVNYSYGTLGVETEKDEYDYGKTTATRKSITKYQTFSANPLGSTIYDRPCQTIIEDSSSNHFAETDYFYDGGATGTVCGTAGSATTISVSNATSHDETNYGPSSTAPRGNATQKNRSLNTGSSPITTLTYDETGQVLSVTDACGNGTCADVTGKGHTTTYQYTDSYASGLGTAPGNTNAYVTTMTDPLSHTILRSFGYNDGQPSSSTDQNSQITNYKYNTPPVGCTLSDGLDRLSEIDYPDGGKTTYCYSDAGSSPSMTTSLLLNSSNISKTNLTVMDGLGHVLHSELTSDPDGTDTADTTYDGMGKTYTASNSHRSASSTTDGTSTYYYDALGRTTEVAEQDGSLLQTCYNGVASTPSVANCSSLLGNVGSGSWVDSTDEAGNHWQRVSDSFGRLTEVMEPNGSAQTPTMETDYAYSILDNLNSVTQWGGANGSTGARSRSFAYDSLSRLLCASNPENSSAACSTSGSGAYVTGTTGYTYDLNGNLSVKTDARNVAVSFTYDGLNRVLTKTAPAVSGTPNINDGFTYDTANSIAAKGGVGRLVSTSSASGGSEQYAYDAMGRMTSKAAYFPSSSSTARTVSAVYDLAGNVTSFTYPDGRTISQGFDGASRIASVSFQSWNGTNINQSYLTVNATSGYDPAGHMINATFGNNVAISSGYDNRGRVENFAYGTATAPLWSKSYSWYANSNLEDYIDQITGVQRQFTYDSLNRLTVAQDIVSTIAGTGVENGGGGSSNGGGGAVGTTPGASGEVPWWTNPDESNILGDINASNSGWAVAADSVLSPNSVVAPDGTMTAASVTASSGSSDTYVTGAVASAYDYTGETMMGSVWLKSASGTMPINLYIVEPSQGSYSLIASKQVQLNTSWQQFQVPGVAQNGGTGLSWQIGGGGSVTAGQSFFIWNPMLEDKGVAGSSVTNFAPYSQRFATWTNTQGSAADNSISAPDGTNTGSILTASSTATDNCVIDPLANPAPYSGMSVTGSVWLKSPSGTTQVLLTLYQGNSSGGSALGAQTITLNTTWQRFQVTGAAESALSSLVFQIGGNKSFKSGMVIHAWGAQVELASIAGPYAATADLPVTVGTTLTNLVPFSQQLDGASWYYNTTTTTSVSVNSDTAPDGTSTAATVTGNSGSSDSYVSDAIANAGLYNKQAVTGSVYLRSKTGLASINLYLVQNGSSGYDISLAKTVSLNSNWQRFQLPGTLDNGLSSLSWQIGGGGSVKASQSYEVWGAQVELNSKAGPYVATSDIPVITGGEYVNILPNSQLLTSASWAKNQTTITVNGDTAPDGTKTAAIVTGTSGTTDGYIADYTANPSLYDMQTVTASVYLRSTTSIPPFNIYLTESGDNGFNATLSQKVTLTSSWQRFEIPATLDNGLTELALQLGGGSTVTGTQSFEVWGPRLDIGSSAGPKSAGPGGTVTNVATGQPGALVAYGLNEAYTYDSFGNLQQNGSFDSGFSANNQMLGYAYDAAGNLLSDGYTVMTWDAESRMATAAGVTYVYDADGNRVEKQGAGVTDTIYFGGRPIARLTAGQWTDLIYGPTGLLAEVPGTQTATPVYRITDHLGNVVGNLLADGSYVNPLDYRPFGGVFSGSTSDPYMFTGKERDTESGLDYFGARYMSSNIGRFMSPDWSAKIEPVPYSSLDNPQTLNLYSYVGNNPLSRADADGHASLVPCGFSYCFEGDHPGQLCNTSLGCQKRNHATGELVQQLNQTAPTNADGTPASPPVTDSHGEPIVPGVDGWKKGPGSAGGDRDTRWGPTNPVPADGRKGEGQPNASWDPVNGHWDVKTGKKGETVRVLPDGTRVDHWNQPVLRWGDPLRGIIENLIKNPPRAPTLPPPPVLPPWVYEIP